MCEPNDFYLRVFTFWFDRESIIPVNFGFAISVCRLRERGRICSLLCDRMTALISRWDE